MKTTFQSNGGQLCFPGREWCDPSRDGEAGLDEAIKSLNEQPELPPFTWSDGLYFAAEDHAIDCNKSEKLGHFGSDGSNPKDRIKRYGDYNISGGENVSYGMATGLRVVLQLYLDDGVANRGHRKNLESILFTQVGIAS